MPDHVSSPGVPTTSTNPYPARLERCRELMRHEGLDVLLLNKPANMYYLTGDGRLCAFAMITRDGQVALGVPVTDVEDVRALAHHDLLAGFDDEVGMIHGIAHYFAALWHHGRRHGTGVHLPDAVHDGHAHPPPRQAGRRHRQGLHPRDDSACGWSRTTTRSGASAPPAGSPTRG